SSSTTAPRSTPPSARTRCAPAPGSSARSRPAWPPSSSSRTRLTSAARRGARLAAMTNPLVQVTFPAPSADGPLDGVALVVLDRPEVLNALDFELIKQLTAALEALDGDAACRAIVITGAG